MSTKAPNAATFVTGQILAVDAVNSPREFIVGKKLVANRARIAPDVLRDSSIDLTPLAG